MPRGGARTGTGPKLGSKQKRTIERELLAERAAAESQLLEAAAIENKAQEIIAARAAGKRLGKEILSEFANVLAGAAAFFQPRPDGSNSNQDEAKFFKYAELAVYAAKEAAAFESPRLAAVMIGQAQTKKIEVEGGLPSPTSPPALTNEQHEQAMKVVNGPTVRDPDAKAPDLSPEASSMLQ